MRFVIKGRDGVYHPSEHRLLSASEESAQRRECEVDQAFEAWYQLWRLSGKRFIDNRFQTSSKTPLDK